VSDIVRGSLLARLRGPRGGWPFALSAFALTAPLFLVLTDILQAAFPYQESHARTSVLEAHGGPAAGSPQSALLPQHAGGLPLTSQPAFLILAAGHLIVAAAVLAGLRRTALAALVIAAAADYTQWTAFHVLRPGLGTLAFLTIAVFPLEAIALASAGPRPARRREGWQHVFPVLALAVAAQLLAFSSAASRAGEPHVPSGDPLVILAAAASGPSFGPSLGRLPQSLGMGPMRGLAAHTVIVTVLYLPPLLVLSRAVAKTVRTRRPRGRGDLAA
jgi:hypothetical protein